MSKLNDTQLTTLPFSQKLKWHDLAVIGYTDAARGDRVDGRSTGGYVLTMDRSNSSLKVT